MLRQFVLKIVVCKFTFKYDSKKTIKNIYTTSNTKLKKIIHIPASGNVKNAVEKRY